MSILNCEFWVTKMRVFFFLQVHCWENLPAANFRIFGSQNGQDVKMMCFFELIFVFLHICIYALHDSYQCF